MTLSHGSAGMALSHGIAGMTLSHGIRVAVMHFIITQLHGINVYCKREFAAASDATATGAAAAAAAGGGGMVAVRSTTPIAYRNGVVRDAGLLQVIDQWLHVTHISDHFVQPTIRE